MVLFFDIRTSEEAAPYNYNNQQNRAGLWADFFSCLFFQLTVEERKWLIQKVLELQPKHVGFSLHLRGDVGVFFLNLEEACHINVAASKVKQAKTEIIHTFCADERNFTHGYCRRPRWVEEAQELQNPANVTQTAGFRTHGSSGNKQFCIGDTTKGVPKQWPPSFSY